MLQPARSKARRRLLSHGGEHYEEVPVFWRPALQEGEHFQGPALLDDEATTLLLPAGYAARVVADRYVLVDEIEEKS
jgi:N-methylhydantoinase A